MGRMMMVYPPFSNDQVWSLNAFQDTHSHWRCPKCDENLVATCLGITCRNGCDYIQAWAYDVTANWSWKDEGFACE